MKRQQLIRLYGFVVGFLLLAACAPHRLDLSNIGADELYQRATSTYESGDYGGAIPLLRAFVNGFLADPRAPQAQLMLGQANMERKDYITAVAEFQHLLDNFPGSSLGLQARFSICQAYNELSPKAPLDQQYTTAALAHCQSVAANFPGTPEAAKASAMVTELSEKLAKKDFDNAMFYFKRKAYDAAVVYFKDVATNYYDTSYAPRALEQLAKTYDILGYVEEAEQARSRLLSTYPASPAARAVQPDTAVDTAANPMADTTSGVPAGAR